MRASIRSHAGGKFTAKVVAHLCQWLEVSLESISVTWLIMGKNGLGCSALFDCTLGWGCDPDAIGADAVPCGVGCSVALTAMAPAFDLLTAGVTCRCARSPPMDELESSPAFQETVDVASTSVQPPQLGHLQKLELLGKKGMVLFNR